jgi:hypothetical protein
MQTFDRHPSVAGCMQWCRPLSIDVLCAALEIMKIKSELRRGESATIAVHISPEHTCTSVTLDTHSERRLKAVSE